MSTKFSRLSAVAGLALATAAGTAQAVNIAADGIGEVVVGSYYTAQPGYQTLLNLTNTQGAPIAVKIRIHEARNSRDVLDYTLTLSAFDVYTAVIKTVSNTDGSSSVVVRNTDSRNAQGLASCTVPQSVPFLVNGTDPDAFNASSDFALASTAYGGAESGQTAYARDDDGGPLGHERLTEGYIEIISLGYALEEDPDAAGPTYQTNASDVVVAGQGIAVGNAIENHQCNRVQASFSSLNGNGTTPRIVETARQMGEPINALKGAVRVLNLSRGTESDVTTLTLANFYNGDAADNFADPTASLGAGSTGHTVGESLLSGCTVTRGAKRDNVANTWSPAGAGGSCNNLITKQVTQAFLEPTLNDAFPAVANVFFDGPNAFFNLTPRNNSLAGAPRGIDAVSALIQSKRVINEWVASDANGVTSTEWVVTMPTKLFYVDPGFGPQAAIFANSVTGIQPPATTQAETANYVRPEAIIGTENGVNTDVDTDTFYADDFDGYAPFNVVFDQALAGNRGTAEACVSVGAKVYDRAEQATTPEQTGDGVTVSPAPPDVIPVDDICYEVNVISFDGRNANLGHVTLENEFDVDTSELTNRNGWMSLELATNEGTAAFLAMTATNAGGADFDMLGLPVIGFAYKERSFGAATRNYSSTSAHAYLRDLRSGGQRVTGLSGAALTTVAIP